MQDNTFGENGRILLKYACGDSLNPEKMCVIKDCFAFSKSGALYLSQGLPGYYYRAYIVGSLTHFIAFTGYGSGNIYISQEPVPYTGSANDYTEYLLDMETGDAFRFTYKNFSGFLSSRDPELYQELMSSRKKRKMIYYFMLKYNEKHPLYLAD